MTAEAQLYRTAMTRTLIAVAVLAIGGGIAAFIVAGGAGLFAAMVGAIIGGLAAVSTPAAMMIAHRRAPHIMAAIVAFTSLGVLIVFVAALLVLRNVDGFEKAWFAGLAIATVVAGLGIALFTLRSARIPYVDPGSS